MPRTAKQPTFLSNQVEEGRYFFFDLAPDRRAELVVVGGGWEQCRPNYEMQRQDFPYFSLEFVTAGHGSLTLAGRRFDLRPGDLFHYGPGIAHHIRSTPEQPLAKFFIDFVGTAAAKLLTEPPYVGSGPLPTTNPPMIRSLFDELLATGASATRRAPRLCAVLVELLLLRVAETRVAGEQRDSHAWSTYERCRRLIEQRCVDLPSLDGVCKQAHVDKAYLCRLFQRFAEESPYHLLTRLKMTRAAELLLHSDLLAKEVANAVGYGDPYHFSRVFKRIFSLSPAAFRARGRRRP